MRPRPKHTNMCQNIHVIFYVQPTPDMCLCLKNHRPTSLCPTVLFSYFCCCPAKCILHVKEDTSDISHNVLHHYISSVFWPLIDKPGQLLRCSAVLSISVFL